VLKYGETLGATVVARQPTFAQSCRFVVTGSTPA
jgi:hypothetical protein